MAILTITNVRRSLGPEAAVPERSPWRIALWRSTWAPRSAGRRPESSTARKTAIRAKRKTWGSAWISRARGSHPASTTGPTKDGADERQPRRAAEQPPGGRSRRGADAPATWGLHPSRLAPPFRVGARWRERGGGWPGWRRRSGGSARPPPRASRVHGRASPTSHSRRDFSCAVRFCWLPGTSRWICRRISSRLARAWTRVTPGRSLPTGRR